MLGEDGMVREVWSRDAGTSSLHAPPDEAEMGTDFGCVEARPSATPARRSRLRLGQSGSTNLSPRVSGTVDPSLWMPSIWTSLCVRIG